MAPVYQPKPGEPVVLEVFHGRVKARYVEPAGLIDGKGRHLSVCVVTETTHLRRRYNGQRYEAGQRVVISPTQVLPVGAP